MDYSRNIENTNNYRNEKTKENYRSSRNLKKRINFFQLYDNILDFYVK